MEEVAEDNGRVEILDDGGQRNEGMGAEEQAGELDERPARPKRRGEGKAEKAVLQSIGSNVQPQSAAEIGVKDGSSRKSLYVLRQSDIDQSARWKRIQEDAQADGARVIFFSGNLSVYNSSKENVTNVQGVHKVDEKGESTYYIKADSKTRNAEQIYKHEKFHNLVSNNPELMDKLMDAMEQEYSKQEIARLVQSYIDAFDGIYGEITDDMTEKAEQKLIRAYMEEILADAYADIKRGKYSIQNAKTILKSQTDAGQRAEQNKKATGQKTAPPEQRYLIYEGFPEELHRWLEKTSKDKRTTDGGWFVVGTVSKALQSIGVRPSEIYWRKYKIGVIMDSHLEMTEEVLQQVPQLLENPIIVAKSLTQNDSVVAFGELKAQNGDNVMVAVNLTPIPTGGMAAEFSLIASAYSRGDTSIRNLLTASEILYLSENKKRTDSWLMSLGLQLPSGQPVYGSIGSISYENGTVNIKGKKIPFNKARGTQKFSVSEEMDAEYLAAVERGNMETAQRMVDEAAKRLDAIRGYHQTENDFTVFDTSHKGAGSSDYLVPFGIFLKPDNANIGIRGSKQMPLYAFASKSLVVKDREDLLHQLLKDERYSKLYHEIKNRTPEYEAKLKKAGEAIENYIKKWRKDNPNASRTAIYNDDQFNELHDAEDSIVDEWERLNEETTQKAKKRIVEYLQHQGYDSLIIENDQGSGGRKAKAVIVFENTQVKSAEPVVYDDEGNVIPLSQRFNPAKTDIRFSVEEDAAELDRQWRDTVAEDGLWSENPAEADRILAEIAKGYEESKGKLITKARKAEVHIRMEEECPAGHSSFVLFV